MEKSQFFKSRSSITNITMQSLKTENSSRNKVQYNAIQQLMKKRGVYVEIKNTTKTDSVTQTNRKSPTRIRAPPRPRPGQKKFLTSVLNILSQTTVSTQHPTASEDDTSKGCLKTVTHSRISKNKNKPKYKSRVLNVIHHQDDDTQIITLKPKRDIVRTPSNCSGLWSDFQTASEFNETDGNKRLNIKASNEKDAKMYDFFVDLIETTMEAKKGNSVSVLHIDESVADKLNEGKELISIVNYNNKVGRVSEISLVTVKAVNKLNKPKTETHNEANEYFYKPFNLYDTENCDDEEEVKPKVLKKTKLKSKSASFTKRHQNKAKLTTQSTQNAILKKQSIVTPKKNNLLQILKQQLRIDSEAFVEPQNLFEALRVIAKNKRRGRHGVSFEGIENKKEVSEDDNACVQCFFNGRRKILTPKKDKKKYESKAQRIQRHNVQKKNKKQETELGNLYLDESLMSLKVFEIDRVPCSRKMFMSGNNKDSIRVTPVASLIEPFVQAT